MTRENDNSDKSAGSIKPGTRLNDIYEVTALLAVGGMSEVYKGHNIQTLDEVAIKVILPHLASDPQVISLFKQEASILNSLGHDAIVRYHVFSVDRATNTAYLTMELVEGPSLYERIRDRPLSLAEAAKMISRIASGLKVAHERGVIHRDISCDNIILSGGNVEGAKLIDFGIARLGIGADRTLLAGSFAGKYNYVSPEQLGLFGGDVHEPSDIYSLGLVFAAALRGKPIDMSGTHADVVRKRQSIPDLSTIHPAARSVIQRMLQPSPALRPKKDEIIEALRPMIPTTKEPTLRRSSLSAGGQGQKAANQSAAANGHAGRWMAIAIALIVLGGAGWYGYTRQDLISSYLTAGKTPASTTPPGKSEFKLDADQGGRTSQTAQDQAKIEPEAKPEAKPEPQAKPVEPKPEAKIPGADPLPGVQNQPQNPPSSEPQKPQPQIAKPSDGVIPKPLGEVEWVRQFSGGTCFFAQGNVTGPRTMSIEGFAPTVEPFRIMERRFIEGFNYEPTIHVRQVTQPQCGAVAFLANALAPSGKATFALKNEVLKPADPLVATLTGLERNQVSVLLVREDGTVDAINTDRRRGADLAINLKLAAPRQNTSMPYMLIAIQSDEKIDISTGGDTFKSLAAKLQKMPAKPIVTVKYFRQQG